MFKINCLFCINEYFAAKKTTKFCSRSCGSKWNHQNNTNLKHTLDNLKIKQKVEKIIKICQLCNTNYEVQRKRDKKTKYCSHSCQSKSNYLKNKQIMIDKARKVCLGRVAPNKGKSHTQEALKKILDASLLRGNGIFGIKYKPFVDKLGRIYNLKSSWEIIFALDYLEKNNINWEYEPTRFLLSNGKVYIPDFHDKTNNIWYEIKGLKKEGFLEKFALFQQENPGISIQLLDNRKIIQDTFKIDMSDKYIKQIRQLYRRNNDRNQNKSALNGRSSVDLLTSGIIEKSIVENPEYAGNS